MCFKVIIFRQHFCPNQFFLQNLYEIQKVLRILIANVVDCIRRNWQTIFSISAFRCALHDTNNTFHNIVHISKVTLAVAIVENLNRLTFQQLISETEVSHIRAASRPIYRKEAQTRRRNVVEFGICVSHQLVRFLSCRIQRNRIIYLIICAVRNFLIAAVDRRTRRIDQMFYRSMSLIVGMTASFQNVIEANQVCFYISVWIRDRVTNARLCAEIDNDLRLILLKNSCDCFLIC